MIGLLGSGSWATAIVKILLEHKEQTLNWWVREPEIIEGLKNTRHNPMYLSDAEIDVDRINLSEDLQHVIESSDDIFIVIPSAFLSMALESVPAHILKQKNFHIATKGLIPETHEPIGSYLMKKFGISSDQITIVSGPSHAEETAMQKLTYLAVASHNIPLAKRIQEMLNCRYIKTAYYDNPAMIQYATVMKNIYAIAAGMCQGLGYGDNLIAVMVSRAMHEAKILIQAISNQSNTNGSIPSGNDTPTCDVDPTHFSFLGDLLVTCYSQHSRNRTFGQMIGHGYSVKGAQLEMNMIAEGYYGVKGIETVRKELGIEMPIQQTVYRILYEGKSARRQMQTLLENLY